ncbi:MAG: hypothetical protein DRJ01_11590 [Bacteroidetes bacterium]|nr:MAG: hypothetical protein DRJ01_11590 [Bacteroidota bacterium]
MEWEGLIVNAGLRFDFWYLGEKYKIHQDDGTYKWEKFKNNEKSQMMMSPRLGVSHPISETTVLHFAYNYQNQLPQMQYIFTTSIPEDAITSDVDVVVGKPNLKPQITITYEVGLNKQLSENYVMDITTYYKNIYNYVSTRKTFDPDDPNIYWYEYISEDYGSTRGIDLNLRRELSNFISGSASYSIAWANGNNSDTVIQDQATNLREFPLDWDLRNSFNLNLTFKIARGEEFYLPLTNIKLPFDNFSTTFRYQYASGKPYTAYTLEGNRLDTNNERQDPTQNAGLRITKKFSFSDQTSIRLFADIDNLFDKTNIYYVYPRTGSPYYDGVDISNASSGYVDEHRRYIHDLANRNPAMVSSGRTVTLGLSFNW